MLACVFCCCPSTAAGQPVVLFPRCSKATRKIGSTAIIAMEQACGACFTRAWPDTLFIAKVYLRSVPV